MSYPAPASPTPKSIRDVKRERILVIEDEPDILEVVRYNLAKEGYRVSSSTDGIEGLAMATREAPDLIILDLMLPGMDGIEICRRLRQDPVTRHIPIIMATAKSEESDLVLGLGVGADDYIVKPFRPRELLARCQAVLRRGGLREESGSGDRVVVGPLIIDASRHEVTLNDKPIDFTATEFRLLHFLASHPGRVFDRAHLISRTIGDHAIVLDRNIDVHVRSLRRKLGECRDYIETVRGVGYRFKDPRRTD